MVGLLSAFTATATSCSDTTAKPSPPPNPRVANVQHFNPRLLRKNVADAPQRMLPSHPGAVPPTSVHLDAEGGKYIGAVLTYPKTVSLEPMRLALNQLYGKYEKDDFADDPGMGLWRNEDEQFAIQLTENHDGILVIYLTFQPLEEVFEHIEK